MAAEKKETSKLFVPTRESGKLYKIDDHVLCAVSGIVADGLIWLDFTLRDTSIPITSLFTLKSWLNSFVIKSIGIRNSDLQDHSVLDLCTLGTIKSEDFSFIIQTLQETTLPGKHTPLVRDASLPSLPLRTITSKTAL